MLTRRILLTFAPAIPSRLSTVSIPLRLLFVFSSSSPVDCIPPLPFRPATHLQGNDASHIDPPPVPRLRSDLATLRYVHTIIGLLWHLATAKEDPRHSTSPLSPSHHGPRLSTQGSRQSAHDSRHLTQLMTLRLTTFRLTILAYRRTTFFTRPTTDVTRPSTQRLMT